MGGHGGGPGCAGGRVGARYFRGRFFSGEKIRYTLLNGYLGRALGDFFLLDALVFAHLLTDNQGRQGDNERTLIRTRDHARRRAHGGKILSEPYPIAPL
jgi:hypothetical protein